MDRIKWKDLIPGCFAGETAPFGGHSYDKERAEKMLRAAMRDGAGMEEILLEVEKYLRAQGANDEWVNAELKRIKSFKANPLVKQKLGRAWLITKERVNASGEVVLILDYRKSGEKIKDFIENLYICENYSLHEKLTYARSRKHNPYPAEFEKIKGISWEGRITCGHNPFFLGRLVTNLIITYDKSGEEELHWDEMPVPKNLI